MALVAGETFEQLPNRLGVDNLSRNSQPLRRRTLYIGRFCCTYNTAPCLSTAQSTNHSVVGKLRLGLTPITISMYYALYKPEAYTSRLS